MDRKAEFAVSRLKRSLPVLLLLGLAGCASAQEEEWISLFNGEDLTGWTIKISGNELGEDPWETFRVEDGLLTVGYENYDEFGDRFGHLFYEESFSHYHLKVEYRFLDPQAPGAPGWAFKNNGVMFHSQSAESMLLDQDFPISIEAQLLGGNGVDDRPTGNVCTPGTEIEIGGVRAEAHCISADGPTFHGQEWVTFDLVVLGDSVVHHIVGADTVMTYSRLTVGGGTVEAFGPGAEAEGSPLSQGYLALQAESHPVQFRKILLKRLPASN